MLIVRVDWAEYSHDVCVMAEAGAVLLKRRAYVSNRQGRNQHPIGSRVESRPVRRLALGIDLIR